MQLRNQIKLRLLQAALEQFGKEVVIAIPLSLLIEWNYKQVSMFKGFQPRMASAGNRASSRFVLHKHAPVETT